MNETLLSIAKRCGVSTTTVSRVLSGQTEKYRISKATAEKVLKMTKACNFSPNLLAQGLSTNRSKTVGLLLPALSNSFFAEAAHTIISEMRLAGYTTVIIDTTEDEDTFSQSLISLMSRKVDGIIAAPCGHNASIPEEIEEKGTPIVLIDRFYQESHLSFVATNNYKGGYDATQYLIDRGHKDVVCFSGLDISPITQRCEGYLNAMTQAGLVAKVVNTGNDFTIQNSYLETRLLLNRKTRPTAIFALTNIITLGVVKALKEAGVAIGKDISLISFDNQLYMDYMEPNITRISQPTEDMAKLAVKLLLDKMSSSDKNGAQLLLDPSLIEGTSVSDLR